MTADKQFLANVRALCLLIAAAIDRMYPELRSAGEKKP